MAQSNNFHTKFYSIMAALLMLVFAHGSMNAGDIGEYGDGAFALDLGVGANFDLSSLNQAERDVFGQRPSTVTQVTIRPSYFFSRHWGAYADLRFNLFRFHSYEKFLDLLVPGLSKLKPMFSVGGVYRYEHTRWQIQPRAGVGFNIYGSSKSSMKINGDEEYQKISGDLFCFDAGLSIAYRLSHICALYVDCSTMQQLIPAKYSYTVIKDGVANSGSIKSRTWGNNMSVSIGVRLQTSTRK